ncbi:MAG: NAD(P)H-hydrate epimerase [Parasporobacterium sp.]|nr:NAD(P)H-hydrate epimerase [Parasporobacterium sp.]
MNISERNKIPAVSVETMRYSDAWTIEHRVSSKELMFRAGKAIYESAEWKEPVAIVCGKGNNAGDGYVVARLMREHNIECRIFLISDVFSEDGRYYFDICQKLGIPYEMITEDTVFNNYGSVLDCIFGTGFKGTPGGLAASAIDAINNSGAYVVSADINSGLNGDTGLGDKYVISDLTVSIGTYKTGHFLGHADKAIRNKTNADIGIEIKGNIIWFEQ